MFLVVAVLLLFRILFHIVCKSGQMTTVSETGLCNATHSVAIEFFIQYLLAVFCTLHKFAWFIVVEHEACFII
jgi:hypothetical protein